MLGVVRGILSALAGSSILVGASTVDATPLVPGTNDPGFDSALEAKADAFDRQIHALSAVPLGWGLEAVVPDPGNRALVAQFIASGQNDFSAVTGKHPYEIVSTYAEAGDLGMFGGVEAAGDAFRYAVLRDSGAPQADVDLARDRKSVV